MEYGVVRGIRVGLVYEQGGGGVLFGEPVGLVGVGGVGEGCIGDENVKSVGVEGVEI